MNAPARTRTRVVMKFGGTSVANVERIRAVAQRVKREVDAGHDVAVELELKTAPPPATLSP